MSKREYNMSERFGGHGLLHTPEGVRDLYNAECASKNKVQDNIRQMIGLYGFKDIQTPTFEYFDIFNKERGTIASKEMYKFFDKEGNTLVLRPDITPSIARCAAKYYKEEELPIRLSYVGNTYINTTSYQGKLKEVTQVGAELINDDRVDADAEMIALTIECLLKAGLTEFQVEIGHADFFGGIVEEAKLVEEEVSELRHYIENKNIFGVENLVSKKDIPEKLKELLLKLPDLFGDENNLVLAKSFVKNERSLRAIARLEELNEILTMYGLEKYITFDLGMMSKYNYYTGIIFRAYTYGTGDAIVTGGRYDNLVEQFGKVAAAIGFAIVIDQLMIALERQKVEIPVASKNTLILYQKAYREMAVALGNHFRKDGMCVEMLLKEDERSIQDYMAYGERNGNGGILFMENEDVIQVIDLATNSVNRVRCSDLLQ